MANSISGQIELYTHHPFLPTLVKQLSRLGLRVCATYLIESQFMEDKYKFFRYVLSSAFPCLSGAEVCILVAYCPLCQPW